MAAALLAPAAVNMVYGWSAAVRSRRRRWPVRTPECLTGPAGTWRRITVDVALLSALAVAGAALFGVRHALVDPSDVSVVARGQVTSLDVAIREVRGRPSGRPSAVARVVQGGVSGLLWLTWPADHDPPERGELLRVTGALRRPGPPRNPAAFDFARYLSNRGIGATLSVERTERLGRARGAAWASAWVERTVRERIGGEAGALMAGLLLGRTSAIPDACLESFRRAGTVHVLAVSGLHVGFISVAVYALLRVARVPRRAARTLIVPVLAAFVAVVGPRPSVVRASIMAAALIGGWSFERRPNPLNAVGLAATAILLARPGALFDLGFALSFAATTAIITLFQTIRGPLSALDRLGRAGRLLGDSLAVSASAQLGVAPVLVAAFGHVSVAALLANLAVVPLAGFAVISGMAMLTTACAPQVSRVFAAAAFVSLKAAGALSAVVGGSTWASVSLARRLWPAPATAAIGLALVTLAKRAGRLTRPSRMRGAFAVVWLTAATLTAALVWSGPGRDHLRLIVFDVGQGDAILLETRGGRRALVDAGGAWGGPAGGDAGRDVVLPYLLAAGGSHLDLVVATHAHADHVGGLASLLRACSVGTLALPLASRGNREMSDLAGSAGRLGAQVMWVARGDTLLASPSCTLTVVWPPPGPCPGTPTENDGSIVLRVGAPGVAFLLTGDVEATAERAVVAGGAGLRADVLKVPHHGSRSSSCAEFLRAVGPSLGLVSVGRNNRYGHPDDATLERLRLAGVDVLRTDADGAIVVDVGRNRVVATGFASGRTIVARGRRQSTGSGPATATER